MLYTIRFYLCKKGGLYIYMVGMYRVSLEDKLTTVVCHLLGLL